MNLTARKQAILKHFDNLSGSRNEWINKNSYFYRDDYAYMKFLVGKGQRILDLGCGTGQLLDALKPSYGLGVDLSANMVDIAQKKYPNLEFIQGDIENP